MRIVGVIMAGGRGSRLGFVEKGLLTVRGRPFIDRVYDVVRKVVNDVVIAVSPHTPRTYAYCKERGYTVINTPGLGFVLDLRFVFKRLQTTLLITPVDLPLITPEALAEFLNEALKHEVDVVTLRLSDECVRIYGYEYVGIGLLKGLKGSWIDVVLCRYPDFLNVNTPEDLERLRKIVGDLRNDES